MCARRQFATVATLYSYFSCLHFKFAKVKCLFVYKNGPVFIHENDFRFSLFMMLSAQKSCHAALPYMKVHKKLFILKSIGIGDTGPEILGIGSNPDFVVSPTPTNQPSVLNLNY